MYRPAFPADRPQGVLTDAALDRLAQLIPQISQRTFTAEEGDFVLSSLPVLVEECRNTRRKLETIAHLAQPDNVVIFQRARA